MIDLTLAENEDTYKQILFFLLDNPCEWRQRSIEHIELSSALWSEREREIDVKPLKAMLADFGLAGDESVRLVLPITLLPKIPLIDLSISVAGTPVYRVSGSQAGKLQAEYIFHLIEEAGVAPGRTPARPGAGAEAEPGELREFLAEMFGLAPGPWIGFLVRTGKYGQRRIRKYEHRLGNACAYFFTEWPRLYRYLMDGLIECELQRYLTYDMYKRWCRKASDIRRLVRREVAPHNESVAENPLIALPSFVRHGGLSRVVKAAADPSKTFAEKCQSLEDEVNVLLENLRVVLYGASRKAAEVDTSSFWSRKRAQWSLVEQRLRTRAARSRREGRGVPSPSRGEGDSVRHAARRLVATYAGYGRRWELFAECVVPLNDSFIIKVSDRRAIYFSHPRKGGRELQKPWFNSSKAWEWVMFKDAVSNHLNIRVTDTSVELGKCELRGESRNLKECAAVDHLYNTEELFSAHSGSRRRPDRVWIKCPLRPAHFIRSAHWLVLAGTAAALTTLLRLVDLSWSWPASALWWWPPSWWPPFEVRRQMPAPFLTLLLLPTTFAVSLLLARESSTLSGHTTRRRKVFLMMSFAVLWGLALWLLATGHVLHPR
ncbi:hypothetical protein [Microbispora bryophytorum]|uniref:hypothetical protein n=1 Tax=Microbispora bryophytorum TaxID=1460882 RepID=UPI0033F9EC85